jgi:hypothetical protein
MKYPGYALYWLAIGGVDRMLSTTMDVPLLRSRLMDYAGDHHGSTEIVRRGSFR